MPRTDIDRLGDDSRIWIFAISPALDEPGSVRLLQRVDAFLDQWAAHGAPITSSRDLIEGSFLLIAVDQRSETSGCSIDRMFGTLKELERELHVAILDANRIFFRHGDGEVGALPRDAFRRNADPDTIVFDTLAERLGEVRTGGWERRAADSWHAQLLA
ncbi:MAG TPA: hypothetical protein VGR02_20255 [Thermoanaerobaculia bacterium]|jgi:hypothetical protein|nr:hypothetical protein [Thermoanaerobaculia bacterium]